jgi:hypothetical protein
MAEQDVPEIRAERRVAAASIRGYFFQFLCTIQNWLALGPDEVLWCEGNEDIDRVLADGTAVEEQVKHLKDSLTESSRTLQDVLLSFAVAFHFHDARGRRVRLVFRTTAALESLRAPILETWLRGAFTNAASVGQIFVRLAQLAVGRQDRVAQSAIEYITAGGREAAFLKACEWTFGEREYSEMRRELVSQIAKDGRAEQADPNQLVDGLIAKVAITSSHQELARRALSALDLDLVINDALVGRVADRYVFGEGDRSSVSVATADSGAIGVAVALRVEDDERARATLGELISSTRSHPRFDGDGSDASVLQSTLALDPLSKMDMDLFIAFGSVEETRRQRVRGRWLCFKVLRLARPRARSPRVHLESEDLRQNLFPTRIPIEVSVAPAGDPLVALGQVIANWVLEARSEPRHSGISALSRKVRCAWNWDTGYAATQEDAVVGWFALDR